MCAQLKVLVTGATGHLGTAVCEALLSRGHQVRATDRKFTRECPAKPVLGDLLDEHFVYEQVDGCDAVVHLGNHPNLGAGPSHQQILADNVRMNANVFWAAVQTGIRRIVFASSIQVMLRHNGMRRDQPYQFPYLPLDGNAPTDPGTNTYAFSKEVGERALQVLCDEYRDLSATSLRFPMLPRASWVAHLRQTKLTLPGWINLGECLTHLLMPDAGRVTSLAIERQTPGYRQYFPAMAMQLHGKTTQDLYREYYSHVPLRCPLEDLAEFVDLSALKDELGFVPEDRIVIDLNETTA